MEAKNILKVRIFTKDFKQDILFLEKYNYLHYLSEYINQNFNEKEIERIYIDYEVDQIEIDFQNKLKDFKNPK